MGNHKNFIIFSALLIIFCLLSLPVSAYNSVDGVQPDDRIIVDYVMTIQGDSEPYQEGQGFTFSVKTGEGGVILGFYEGVLGMKVGEQKEIIVPPEKGYDHGELANETLIFDTYLQEILCCNSSTSETNSNDANTELELDVPISMLSVLSSILLVVIYSRTNRQKSSIDL